MRLLLRLLCSSRAGVACRRHRRGYASRHGAPRHRSRLGNGRTHGERIGGDDASRRHCVPGRERCDHLAIVLGRTERAVAREIADCDARGRAGAGRRRRRPCARKGRHGRERMRQGVRRRGKRSGVCIFFPRRRRQQQGSQQRRRRRQKETRKRKREKDGVRSVYSRRRRQTHAAHTEPDNKGVSPYKENGKKKGEKSKKTSGMARVH